MSSTPLHLADRYRLYEQIGTGRFATVWLAWDELLGRLVAVKVVKASKAAVPVFRTRFVEQVRQAARLSHPVIVTIHDFGESGVADGVPLPFVVMELLSGETLAARLGRNPLPRREALRLCEQVASALAHAHAAGTAHYDLRPGNVFLTDDGPKVLDFGTGKLLGGLVADAAAEDVRALGLLLSAAVTGRPDSEAELPSEVPHEVAAVHVRCLLPDPASRPSAAEVAAVLAGSAEPRRPAVPGGAGILAERARRAVHRRARRAHRAVRRARVRRRAAVLLSAVAVAAIVILVFRGGSSDRGMAPPTMEAKVPTDVSRTTTESAAPSPTGSAPESTPASASTASGPTPMDTPKPTRKAEPTPPRPTSAADPDEVLARAGRSVDDGVAAGEIRSDVGLDLNNVLGNLRRDLQQNPSVDLHARVAEIHNKIDTRLGEQALTASRAARLHAILNEIR
ncbi:protein kinase domain-containing protein [Spirillospora sp. CA-142024]|uniref:protein kinase domain-containing protein n=1 Tax=Spirillospora sp. CA-142024 TaxID=3240036 RepID=UPI003D93E6E7